MGKHNHYRDKGFSRGRVSAGGAEQVEQDLRELGEHVLEAAKKALETGVNEVVADAKSRCPEYQGHKKGDRVYMMRGVAPGALRDSIKATPNSQRTVYKISADAKSEGGFLYGQIVEFSPRVNKPFLYPALDAKKQSVADGIYEAVKSAMSATGGG